MPGRRLACKLLQSLLIKIGRSFWTDLGECVVWSSGPSRDLRNSGERLIIGTLNWSIAVDGVDFALYDPLAV